MSSASQLHPFLSPVAEHLVTTLQPVVCISAHGGALVQDYCEQATVCCEQARQAATMRRLRAACGLFATAIALYRYVLQSGSALLEERTRQQIENGLRQVEQEMAIYEALSRSKSRPLAL